MKRFKGVSPTDLYQMMAYARLYDCRRLILLYPAPDGEVASEVVTRGIPPTPDRLDVAAISLNRNAVETGRELRKMIGDPILRGVDV